MHIDQMTNEQLQEQLAAQETQYRQLTTLNLALNLTRGKSCPEQAALSASLDGILVGHYLDNSGTDVRNYGGLTGLAEARSLFAGSLGCTVHSLTDSAPTLTAISNTCQPFESRPGLAREIVELANTIGVKLTPAGATYPHGNDPLDSNIRLAPTFPALQEVQETAKAFVVCVKLASFR